MGVVTVICDHNIHTVSVDIKKYGGRGGGEKYCYALFVLDHIMHQLPGVKFYVSYDLGCAFLKYAKVCCLSNFTYTLEKSQSRAIQGDYSLHYPIHACLGTPAQMPSPLFAKPD